MSRPPNRAQDVGVRRLLGDLAEAEKGHEKVAAKLTDQILSPDVRAKRTRRAGACLSCNTSSPALPD